MHTAKIVLIMAALLAAAEIAARWSISIKLYDADSEVGYWIKPDQAGGALLTGSFAFNEAGFGVARPLDLNGSRDLVLVGDSLVFGTSQLEQDELLGPLLQDNSNWDVWPFATGSSSLANQLRAISRKDLRGAERLVFVLNSEDFKQPSSWTSEFEQPRRYPRSYLIFALQKRFPGLRTNQKPIPVRQGNLRSEWESFVSGTDIPITVIAYDWIGTSGSGCSWLPAYIESQAECFDPFELGYAELVADGIHLSPEGNAVFADWIGDRISADQSD